MFVDPAMLRSGAADTHSAGAHAQAGATLLNQASVAEGIFGGFGAADVFHNAISAAHTEHITTLTDHRRTLADVGDKAHHAAREFTGMDQHNAAQLRAVRCNSGT
ncbi:DUF2563 family protein [Mycolicibacter sinensis]|uniref:DUF2563 domain-containing protein n=1 Tax=Mycolicibacter sinensis (strain JDM601) TaxID=875328 RepID=A0A1A2XQ96_MYCSD|nr:DUF2563 family protein [Mycolicibacter sinensis]OBH18119.1 hypothetical protein A5694_02000 [Mycolicibacter sinensis]OBI27934.1 hypothetical protein A5710_04345 [Mycolicibacter sinensis]